MIPETSPTLSPDSTLPTTTSPTHLATSNSFQFMTTTGTTTVNSLSAMNPATSMMINLDDHSFYQHILSPQQLQQLQLQQHPQNISAISQPSQHLTPYIEHSLNFVQQHYDLGLGISTPPTPNNGGRMQHTVTANPTPPLSKELVSSQDLPAASTASLINSNSTSGSITLPYQQQQQHSNSPIGGGISGSSDTTASMARSKTNNHERSPIYSSALQTTPPDTSLDNTKLQQQTYQHAEQFNQSNMVGLQGLNASTPSPSHQHATRSSPLENSMLLTSNDTQTIGKRSNQDISSSKESSPTTNKKVKQDTNYQLEKSPTPMYFTAASFQYRTREQLIDRLVVLENERVDLLRQTGQSRRKDKLSDEKHKGNRTASPSSVNNNTHTSDDESLGKITNHTNDNSKEEDEDEDDDDDEESESISSVTDNNLNDTSSGNDNTEMRCLWRNCGMACIGVQGLTDHIVRVHVGGGKPLYHCEWENCRRIQKPFTKRHKICNHLRVHTGERPFVCEKPGKKNTKMIMLMLLVTKLFIT
ncbi:hypothetical protein BC941DRAFT_436202 [Chlamydoabsidia padenii]|nr:hypothetical protein BC941DRAFT_436202 [Chlamydoabsidia padenii]